MFRYAGEHTTNLVEIKQNHSPPDKYRVSRKTLQPGASIGSSSRKGDLYVLNGKCRISFNEDSLDLSAGQLAEQFQEGSFQLDVLGETELEIVRVWDLEKIRVEMGIKPEDIQTQ